MRRRSMAGVREVSRQRFRNEAGVVLSRQSYLQPGVLGSQLKAPYYAVLIEISHPPGVADHTVAKHQRGASLNRRCD